MSNLFNSVEYYNYIKKNCGVRGYDMDEQDEVCKRPDVDVILHYVDKLMVSPESKFLEVGCGFGRILFEIYQRYNVKPFGIDVSPKIIEGAKERVGKICSEVKACPAEEINYEDQTFDNVVCWGVFDLTTQEKSIFEMARILCIGGKLLLTGKTNRYLPNDKEAYLAEHGSLRKNIPNHYTDVASLLKFTQKLGLELLDCWCFKMRGDLSINKPELSTTQNLKIWSKDPLIGKFTDSFYEYVLIFEKNKHTTEAFSSTEIIGLKRSLTGLELDEVNFVEG